MPPYPLSAQGLQLRAGMPLDASIISAASSTKNRARKRDEEMSSAQKGGAVVFRYEGAYRSRRGKRCSTLVGGDSLADSDASKEAANVGGRK